MHQMQHNAYDEWQHMLGALFITCLADEVQCVKHDEGNLSTESTLCCWIEEWNLQEKEGLRKWNSHSPAL